MPDSEDLQAQLSSQYTELLNERVGGKALACSDDWFAECANLVLNPEPVFKEGHFVATGQWMDGWESRRSFGRAHRRDSGSDHDWCTLKLGIPGKIRGVDINTSHFRGNAPQCASVEAARVMGDLDEDAAWVEILEKVPTAAHSHNVFALNDDRVWTHLRLNIYPDGGVARFRVYGEAQASRANFVEGELLDLASAMNGGRGLDCSDKFYSSPGNLLMPGRGINMGDGWETRRRRDDGYDWCIVKLGLAGSVHKVLLDTAHFKGNYPDSFMLEGTDTGREDITAADIQWLTIIPRLPLYADQEHLFISEIATARDCEFTHVRLNIFPDGGVSRLRVFGFPNWS